jgi:hypothetical protein
MKEQKDNKIDTICQEIENEIHNNINQVLFAVQLKLNILEKETNVGFIEEIRFILAEVMRDLKKIAGNLEKLRDINIIK